jgi:hypothetical protein
MADYRHQAGDTERKERGNIASNQQADSLPFFTTMIFDGDNDLNLTRLFGQHALVLVVL